MAEARESDLAIECGVTEHARGVQVSECETKGCLVRRVHICTAEAARHVGKPEGRYVTVESDCVKSPDPAAFAEAALSLGVELRSMAERMTGRQVGQGLSVLVVGLGNPRATPDSLGALVTERLTVTPHPLREGHVSLQGQCRIVAVGVGVPAQTGVESATLVRGLCASLQPHLVVAVDALCAKGLSHVCGTVQLSDTGIQPGSGVGSAGEALTEESIGVPVLSMGVPTVIRAAVLVRDMLQKAGFSAPSAHFFKDLTDKSGLFVSPGDVDFLVSSAADLLVAAIERAFPTDGTGWM